MVLVSVPLLANLASLGGALLSVGKICLRRRRQLEVIQITGPSRRVQHAPSGAAVPSMCLEEKECGARAFVSGIGLASWKPPAKEISVGN